MVMCLAVNTGTDTSYFSATLLHIFDTNNQTKLGAFWAPSAMKRSWGEGRHFSFLPYSTLLGNSFQEFVS